MYPSMLAPCYWFNFISVHFKTFFNYNVISYLKEDHVTSNKTILMFQ